MVDEDLQLHLVLHPVQLPHVLHHVGTKFYEQSFNPKKLRNTFDKENRLFFYTKRLGEIYNCLTILDLFSWIYAISESAYSKLSAVMDSAELNLEQRRGKLLYAT